MQKQQPNEANCPSCSKKQQLIHKYVNLIELLKKKSQHQNLSVSLKSSNDHSHNNVLAPHDLHIKKAGLPLVLKGLEAKHKLQGLRYLLEFSIEKRCHRGFKLSQALEKCINRKVQDGTRLLWLAKNKTQTSTVRGAMQPEKSVSSVLLDFTSSPRNKTCFVPGSTTQYNDKINSLSRKVFALTRENEALKWAKKHLSDQIEENYRRQEIQSKKKKESLEMLAEQMAEKNDLINELQTALRFYQSKQGRPGNNVLDEDGVALQRQIDKVEKINEKINIQLEKKTDHLSRAEEELKIVRQKLQKLQRESVALKEKNFEMGVELQNFNCKKEEYNNLTSFLQKKMGSLKKYEKIISNHLKAIEQSPTIDKSTVNGSVRLRNSAPMLQDGISPQPEQKHDQPSFSPISRFQAQYKIEKILNYIFNIQLDDVWINNEEKLYDQEELQVLNSLKLKFIQLNQLVKSLKKQKEEKDKIQDTIKAEPGERMRKMHGESDQVYFNQNHVSGSIFEVLASEKPCKQTDQDPKVSQFQSKVCPNCHGNRSSPNHHEQTSTRRDNQNFTIRLLEMQMQKNKQIQKISQLKNKIMHIRCIVMNFLKSIQFKNIKQEAKDIAELFFELFQYSEQEKEMIFHEAKKEKRGWGFF